MNEYVFHVDLWKWEWKQFRESYMRPLKLWEIFVPKQKVFALQERFRFSSEFQKISYV